MKIKDVKIDPDFQKRLRAYLPIQPELKYTYVPLIFREKDKQGNFLLPKDQWAQFTIESLNALHMAEIQDGFMGSAAKPGSQTIELLRKHIKGWKNWVIPFDESKHMKDGLLTDEAIRMIKGSLMEELLMAILGGNELTEDELRGLE